MADFVDVIIAPFDEDVGDAVAVEIRCAEGDVAAAVAEDGSLEVGAQADLRVGREVFGHDGEAIDMGAVRADEHELGVAGFIGPEDGEGLQGAAGDDVAGFGQAGDDVAGACFIDVHEETAGGGTGGGHFIPADVVIGFDGHAVDVGECPCAGGVSLDIEGGAEIGVMDVEGDGVGRVVGTVDNEGVFPRSVEGGGERLARSVVGA